MGVVELGLGRMRLDVEKEQKGNGNGNGERYVDKTTQRRPCAPFKLRGPDLQRTPAERAGGEKCPVENEGFFVWKLALCRERIDRHGWPLMTDLD